MPRDRARDVEGASRAGLLVCTAFAVAVGLAAPAAAGVLGGTSPAPRTALPVAALDTASGVLGTVTAGARTSVQHLTAAAAGLTSSGAGFVSPALGSAGDVLCGHLVSGAPPLCTHGADPLPTTAASEGANSGNAPTGGSTGCYDDGRRGPRVVAIYAYVQGQSNHYSSLVRDIRSWAAGVDSEVEASAQQTRGERHVRWETNNGSKGCQVVVHSVGLSSSSVDSFSSMIKQLQSEGYNQADNKYLVWADAATLCGIASFYLDDQPGRGNANDGAYPTYARVDRPCWDYAEGHELMHMLGAVQRSAPDSTPGGHCTDGHEIMCYADGTTNAPQRAVCPSSNAWRFDCRHDDYFSTAKPRAGSYLAGHWNTANSLFLSPSLTGTAYMPKSSTSPRASAGPKPSPSPSARPKPSASPSPSPDPGSGALPGVGPGPSLPPLPPVPPPPPLPQLSLPPLP